MVGSSSGKQRLLAVLLLCLLLCSCAKNPTQEQLYAKLIGRFAQAGCPVTLAAVPEGQAVGIADASCWMQLCFADEAETPVLVYFDESNRADYLKTFVDPEAFGLVTRFGQRFVLTYSGSNDAVTALLKTMDE